MTFVLVRHGQSEWNLKNLFTGWKDPILTELGISEAKLVGDHLNGIKFIPDFLFTSALKRSQQTMDIILDQIEHNRYKDVFKSTPSGFNVITDPALNERDYGDLSGLNKDDARTKWGPEQVQIWRRSYDVAPPGGESLKDTANRVIPFFKKHILPKLKQGARILVVAHGNSLRALVKEIELLSEEEILKLEIETGEPIIYDFNENKFVLRSIK